MSSLSSSDSSPPRRIGMTSNRQVRFLGGGSLAGFDKTNYIPDRWGLFNPPGVSVPEDPDEYKDNWRPDFFEEEEEE